MKISNIKYQKSKILASLKLWRSGQIKNKIFLIFNFTLLQVALTVSAFANGDGDHPPGTPHTEAASIDPTMVIGIVIVIFLVIGGLILWKFVLSEKKPPAQEKTVSQNDEKKSS